MHTLKVVDVVLLYDCSVKFIMKCKVNHNISNFKAIHAFVLIEQSINNNSVCHLLKLKLFKQTIMMSDLQGN